MDGVEIHNDLEGVATAAGTPPEPVRAAATAADLSVSALQSFNDWTAGREAEARRLRRRRAGEADLFPDMTNLVHTFSVADPGVGVSDMRDPHRVPADASGRPDNVEQIVAPRESAAYIAARPAA